MKLRLFLALAAVMMLGGMAYAGTAQLESSTVQLAPIVATLDGWDTGLTVINVGMSPLTVNQFEFFSLTGEKTMITGKTYTIPAGGRWSMNASEIIGSGFNGTLKYHIIGSGARHALSYMAVYETGTFNMSPVATAELTFRD